MRSALAPRIALLAGTATVLALAGCGSDAKTSSGKVVPVTSTDEDCQVGSTTLSAGTSVFRVKNEGSRVTEFYVYGEGDKVVGEVEDISPGVSRDLHVKLAAGTYEAACKPGMAGDGIRKTLTVTGQASSTSQAQSLQGAGAHTSPAVFACPPRMRDDADRWGRSLFES